MTDCLQGLVSLDSFFAFLVRML